MLAPLNGLGDGLAGIAAVAGLPTGVPLPLFARTVVGAQTIHWFLPLSVECQLDADGGGTTDVAVRVDPIVEGTTVVGLTIVLRGLSALTLRVAVGMRTDAGVVTSSGPGDWAWTELSHVDRPLPGVTTIALRSTGELENPGDTQDTLVTLAAQGTSVAADLAHAIRFSARGGEDVAGVAQTGRRPTAIGGVSLPTLPDSQTIFVPPEAALAGADTRLAGATGALTGAGPHLSLRQQSTFLETLGTEQVLETTLTLGSTQRLHLDVTSAHPVDPPNYVEMRGMTTEVVLEEHPQLAGSGATRRLDGTFAKVTSDGATDSATLRVPSGDAGAAATLWGLDDLALRLRGDAPLLIELHGDDDPTQPLAQPLPAFAARGGEPGVHPVGVLGQSVDAAPQAAMLDLNGPVYSASARLLSRLRVRERVAGVHARDDSPEGAQDWLVDVEFGDAPVDAAPADRPLRVRLRSEGATTFARAVSLPPRLGVDLHMDPPGPDRDLGARLTGAVDGLRVLTDSPPGEGRTARTRVHAAVPALPAGGTEFALENSLPQVSAAVPATAIVAAHGLGVPAAEDGLALESIDVLAGIPGVEIPADARPDPPSVSLTSRTGDQGLVVAAARPTGVRAAVSADEQWRAVRPTPQVAMGFAPEPETMTEPAGAEMRRVTARVVGLSRLEVGGAEGAGPVPLPGVHLLLDAARVNRSARVHTFDGERADLRVRVADVPDDMAVDLRTAAPVGIGGTAKAPMRRPARLRLRTSARSGEVVIWGEPASRAWYGPAAGRLAGVGLVAGRIPSLPRRMVFAQLHDPALLDSEDETRAELWPEIGSEWVRDGLRFAVSEELVVCRLAIVAWDRDHPSNGQAKWGYTYIHGLKIPAPATPPPDDAADADLPALTVWTPFQVPTDDDTFDESKSALSMRIGPRDGHDDDDRPRVDLWLGKLEKHAGTETVDWRDLMPGTTFQTKGEIILSRFSGHWALAEEFGTFDPTRVDANGPGDWWVRAVGKLPLLGFDVTMGSDQVPVVKAFADRPDFDDPCGG